MISDKDFLYGSFLFFIILIRISIVTGETILIGISIMGAFLILIYKLREIENNFLAILFTCLYLFHSLFKNSEYELYTALIGFSMILLMSLENERNRMFLVVVLFVALFILIIEDYGIYGIELGRSFASYIFPLKTYEEIISIYEKKNDILEMRIFVQMLGYIKNTFN